MKIIIAGAGAVGTHLAKLLSSERQDIILMDDDEERLSVIDSNFDLMTVTASPTSIAGLKDAVEALHGAQIMPAAGLVVVQPLLGGDGALGVQGLGPAADGPGLPLFEPGEQGAGVHQKPSLLGHALQPLLQPGGVRARGGLFVPRL